MAGGGGGASSYPTNQSSQMDAKGLLDPLKDYTRSLKIPEDAKTEDAGTCRYIFLFVHLLWNVFKVV